jgi:general secretion pathway protein I
MNNRQGGFTLIEVVVAFVLLALVMSTALEIFSAGLARAGRLEERSRALVIAQARLATAGVEETLKEGVTSGESEDRKYQWTVTVTRTGEGEDAGKPAPSVYALYRIEARVTWHGADTREQALTLATLAVWTRA